MRKPRHDPHWHGGKGRDPEEFVMRAEKRTNGVADGSDVGPQIEKVSKRAPSERRRLVRDVDGQHEKTSVVVAETGAKDKKKKKPKRPRDRRYGHRDAPTVDPFEGLTTRTVKDIPSADELFADAQPSASVASEVARTEEDAVFEVPQGASRVVSRRRATREPAAEATPVQAAREIPPIPVTKEESLPAKPLTLTEQASALEQKWKEGVEPAVPEVRTDAFEELDVHGDSDVATHPAHSGGSEVKAGFFTTQAALYGPGVAIDREYAKQNDGRQPVDKGLTKKRGRRFFHGKPIHLEREVNTPHSTYWQRMRNRFFGPPKLKSEESRRGYFSNSGVDKRKEALEKKYMELQQVLTSADVKIRELSAILAVGLDVYIQERQEKISDINERLEKGKSIDNIKLTYDMKSELKKEKKRLEDKLSILNQKDEKDIRRQITLIQESKKGITTELEKVAKELK